MSFRKIDVDQYDEDAALTAAELVPEASPVSLAEIQTLGQQVRALVTRGDFGSALAHALDSPPYGGDSATKDAHLRTVLDVFGAVRSSDITPLVEALTPEQQNVLVKYIYKGMGAPAGQGHGTGGVLLSWFEKTVDVTGQGTIIRYISDRRVV